MKRVQVIVGLIALLALVYVAGPCATRPVVTTASDAGSSHSHESAPANDPTAVGGLEVTAPGAQMVAIRSKTYRRAFASDHAAVRDIPLGEYEVFATGPDGNAHAKATVVEGELTRVDLKLAAIPGAVTLRGTVRDILGGTVPGAEVWIDFTIARTDGSGEFEAKTAPGEHALRARAAGYAELTESVSFHSDHRIELVLHPAATVHGVVVHADGSAGGGARVIVSGKDAFDTFADAEGKFTIEGLPAGKFDIRASTATEIGEAAQVVLAPAMTRDVRIELGAGVTIFGRILGADGARLANAKITLEEELREAPTETTSGADGSYRIGPILPGTSSVKACAAEHLCGQSPSRFFAKSPSSPIDVVLNAGATLRLRIVDQNGAPVGSAHAYLADFKNCDSTEDGECVIDHVAPRRTKVEVSHHTAGYLRDEPIDIGPGETRATLQLHAGATVTGTVRWDDGKPAANVEVSGGYRRGVTHTGADGRYELTNVDRRFATIEARVAEAVGTDDILKFTDMHPGGQASVRLHLDDGDRPDGVDLVLRHESQTIAGTVVDAEGSPVPNAGIGLLKDSRYFDGARAYGFLFGEVRTYADADGTFTLEQVAKGTYVVWASAEDHPRGYTRNVNAGSGKVTIKLPASAKVSGAVKEESGAALSRFLVHLDPDHAGPTRRVVDASGRFVLNGIEAGKHKITIECALEDGGGAAATADFEVKAGEEIDLSFVAKRSVTVIGRIVTWPEGSPIAGVELTTWNLAPRNASPSGVDGRFRIESMPLGEARIYTHDARGHSDDWKRTIQGTGDVDLGDFAVAAERGYGSFRYSLHIADDEILSIDGQDTTKLGRESLGGALDAATPDMAIVVKKKSGETVTVHAPPPRPRPKK